MSGRKEKINLMDVIPFISEHITTLKEGDLSIITFPRFRNKFLQKYFVPKDKPAYARIELDHHGTAVWDLIDGKRTVRDICKLLKVYFAEEENYEERILLFVSGLRKQGFLKYKIFSDSLLKNVLM